ESRAVGARPVASRPIQRRHQFRVTEGDHRPISSFTRSATDMPESVALFAFAFAKVDLGLRRGPRTAGQSQWSSGNHPRPGLANFPPGTYEQAEVRGTAARKADEYSPCRLAPFGSDEVWHVACDHSLSN